MLASHKVSLVNVKSYTLLRFNNLHGLKLCINYTFISQLNALSLYFSYPSLSIDNLFAESCCRLQQQLSICEC